MGYVQLIHDEGEVKWFYNHVLPPLQATECYFISLSARNKYLTPEERQSYDLGRTEMFAKTVVRKREWPRFLRTLHKLECDERGYTTRNNTPIPSKAMVCYINIHPSDTLKVISSFQSVINEYQKEMADIAFGTGSTDNLVNRINKLDDNLLTCYQQATGTKHWLDVDFDVQKHEDIIELVNEELGRRNVTHYVWVDTKSGYHLLVDKKQVKFDFSSFVYTVQDLVAAHSTLLKDQISEIIYNKNAMIPLPGTYQGNYPVTVLREFSNP